jgi:flagellar assembly protein FliH
MEMRAAPAKFLFENDFAAGGGGKPSVALEEHAARVRDADAAGFARGFEQGKAEARAEAEQRCAFAIEQILAALGGLGQQLGGVSARLEAEAVEVAVAVARKLAPGLMAREPFAEIEALATACFRNLVKTPHVVVRVNDALHDTTREKLDEIVRRTSPDTKLVVLAEPEIAPGDCRIEWADGGIDRDSAAVAARIDEAVARYLSGQRTGLFPANAHMPDVKWR